MFFYIGYDKKRKSYKTCEATTNGTEKVKIFYRSKKELILMRQGDLMAGNNYKL